MSTTISVNKQTVEQLLGSGKTKPFVIPEYQRPYAWYDEQVETLFSDLWDFTNSNGGTERDGTYFLGSVVSYENENGEQEIIDGQQRITSLYLLLRAIYTKLKKGDQNDKTEHFIKQIEPAIWRADKLTGKVDYSNILLNSRVINNEGNEILRNILKTGTTSKDAKDNYSKNYNLFIELYEKHCTESPMTIFEFIYALLNQAILLPITADTQDTALTIFSTLNDRGLPLSDADIFKAKIYNQLDESNKTSFIEDWKTLEENATEAGESIQSLFYYYMFYLRALDVDKASTTPGLRKYYSANKFEKLYNPNLLENLTKVLNIWIAVNKKEVIEDETWTSNTEIRKALDILNSYPNEFWKYPVVIYYLTHNHKENINFETEFTSFLRKLIVSLLSEYLVMPTVNAVKSDILKLNVEITNSATPKFEFKEINATLLDSKIKNPHKNAVRMILKMLAYELQDTLLPHKWEIEHIFPQKWQTNYFPKADETMIKEKIEFIGNKVPFEKKLNIIAGNGYFEKKKKSYSKSTITITNSLSALEQTNWVMDDIMERSIRVSDKVKELFNTWSLEYVGESVSVEKAPTVEELEWLEKLKAKGLVN